MDGAPGRVRGGGTRRRSRGCHGVIAGSISTASPCAEERCEARHDSGTEVGVATYDDVPRHLNRRHAAAE